MRDEKASERLLPRRAVLAAAAVMPLAAACQGDGGIPAPGPGVTRRVGRLTSSHWPGQRPSWIVMRPTGIVHAPVVVSLHGKGGDARATFSDLGLQRHVAATGLAVAAIDGGNYYWHARRSESTGADDISAERFLAAHLRSQ